jgi:isopentenyl-diphosphate delta-isomerase
MAEQQLLLVDEEDKFLGRYAPKSQCHSGRGLHHRAFTIMILNKKDEVLLQRRKHKLWDNHWNLTNSHPLHREDKTDESYEGAAKRCLEREWGIKIPVKKLFTFNYFAQYRNNLCENEYCAFLLGRYDGKVHPNPEVAYGYRWMPLNKLLKEIKTHPSQYTPWLIKVLEELEKHEEIDFNYLK